MNPLQKNLLSGLITVVVSLALMFTMLTLILFKIMPVITGLALIMFIAGVSLERLSWLKKEGLTLFGKQAGG